MSRTPWRSLRSKGGSPSAKELQGSLEKKIKREPGRQEEDQERDFSNEEGTVRQASRVCTMSDYNHEGRKTKIQTWTNQYRSWEPTTRKMFQRFLPTFAHLYQKDAYPEGHSSLVPNITSGRGRASLTMRWCEVRPPLGENECFLWNFHTEWTLERKRNALMKQEHRGRPWMRSGGVLDLTAGHHTGSRTWRKCYPRNHLALEFMTQFTSIFTSVIFSHLKPANPPPCLPDKYLFSKTNPGHTFSTCMLLTLSGWNI